MAGRMPNRPPSPTSPDRPSALGLTTQRMCLGDGMRDDAIVLGPSQRYEHSEPRRGLGTPDVFAPSSEKNEARDRRRAILVSDRKLCQESRIMEYVTKPAEYAQLTRGFLRSALDSQREIKGMQQAQARLEESTQAEQNHLYAASVDRTHQQRAQLRAQQTQAAAEANKQAIAEKSARKQHERAEERRLDQDSSFMERFGTSLK